MTKQEILAAAGYPNTPEGIAAFYEEYGTPDAFFAKHGGSLSGAPHDGQPTADQFFNYGSHVNDKLNVPMSNPFFLKQGGTYYGGPTRPYAYGGDVAEFCWGGGLPGGPNEMPEMLHGGYHSPMNYGSFPVTSEYGGILDPSNIDAFPMMDDGGTNLTKIIKAASKNMKKAYGGKTTIQGGNENYLESRRASFDNALKNNVYNALIKEEEKAAMQALNPYATGMEQEDQEYPEARYGLSTYQKKGEKQPDDVPVDFRKTLSDLLPVGRDYSKYLPGNISSDYFMSNADYMKMQDISKRIGDKSFELTGIPKVTSEYGALARLLGKTGRRMFGPKSVTYEFTGRGIKQVPVKDVEELNLPGFDKLNLPRITPSSLPTDEELVEMPGARTNRIRVSQTQNNIIPETKRREYELPEMPGAKYHYSDQYIQDQPTTNKSDENIQFDPTLMQNVYDKYMKSKQGYGRKKYGGDLPKAQYGPPYSNALQVDTIPQGYNQIGQYDGRTYYGKQANQAKASPGQGPSAGWEQSIINMLQSGVSPEELAEKKHISKGNIEKYRKYYRPLYTQQNQSATQPFQMQSRQASLSSNFTGDIAQASPVLQNQTQSTQPGFQFNTLQTSGPNLTEMNVEDSPMTLDFKKPGQQVNTLQSSKPTMGNVNAGDIGLSDAEKKAAIVNKAKNFPTGKLTPDKPNLTGPTDTEVGPEETITSKINRKTKGIGKAIGQYAPGVANAWASILEQQDKMEPMQNHPVVLPDEGDYDINTGDYRVRRKVPIQFPGGPGAYRMEYGGIPKALSGLEVKMRPGLYGTNGNRQFSLPTQVDSQKFAQQPTEVRNSLTAVPRDEANLEAEGGETAIVNIDGMPAHFDIKGKRHSQGGVPLNLPDNSFIFSDTASMKIKDPNILAQFGMASKKSGYTPAEIAKKYDINKFRKILSDPNSEDLERKTAEAMIANYNMKLAKLSMAQESIKGFPQGIPVMAMPYMMTNNIDPSMYMPTQGQEEQPDEDMGVQRYGGNIVAQYPTMRYGGLPKAQTGKENLEKKIQDIKAQEAAKRDFANKVSREQQLAQQYENQKNSTAAALNALYNQRKTLEERAQNPSMMDVLIQGFDRDVLSILPGVFDFSKDAARAASELAHKKAQLRKMGQVENINNQIRQLEELNKKLNTPGYTLSKPDYILSDIPGAEYLQGYGYTIPEKATSSEISRFTKLPGQPDVVPSFKDFKTSLLKSSKASVLAEEKTQLEKVLKSNRLDSSDKEKIKNRISKIDSELNPSSTATKKQKRDWSQYIEIEEE